MRDWHKDKEFMSKKAPLSYNDLGVIWYEIAPYWHEKAVELEFWKNEGTAAKTHWIQAEGRENKLREALERIMKMTNKSEAYTTEARVYHEAFKTLASLYGDKEEEAK